MLATFSVPTDRGALRGAATERGLILAALPGRPFDPRLADVEAALGETAQDDASHPYARQLAEYAAGERRVFDLQLDLRAVRGEFRRAVLTALFAVPFGELVTYGELARRVGKPGAARAVGGAVGNNPLAPVVPCHRVVASGGRIGGFSAGLPLKRWLLGIEGEITHVDDGDPAQLELPLSGADAPSA